MPEGSRRGSALGVGGEGYLHYSDASRPRSQQERHRSTRQPEGVSALVRLPWTFVIQGRLLTASPRRRARRAGRA